jgi:hypothetical protein
LWSQKIFEKSAVILVIAKARNQMDDIDLEDETIDVEILETIDAEILNPKAVCMTISKLHLC